MTYHFHNLHAKKTVMYHCPAAKQKPGETSSASKVHVRNYSAPGSGQDLVEYAASFRIFLHLAAVHLLAFVTQSAGVCHTIPSRKACFVKKSLLYLDLSLADVLIELMRCLTCPVVFFSGGARRMHKRTASPVVRFVIAAAVGIG